jgi:hypothetical protein
VAPNRAKTEKGISLNMVLMVWKRRFCFLEGARVKDFSEMRLPTHLFIGPTAEYPVAKDDPIKE